MLRVSRALALVRQLGDPDSETPAQCSPCQSNHMLAKSSIIRTSVGWVPECVQVPLQHGCVGRIPRSAINLLC